MGNLRSPWTPDKPTGTSAWPSRTAGRELRASSSHISSSASRAAIPPPTGPLDPGSGSRSRSRMHVRTEAISSTKRQARAGPASSSCCPSAKACRRNDRQPGCDLPPAARLIDNVDRVVLPVGTRDPEEDAGPADEAQPAFLSKRLRKLQQAPAHDVIGPGRLLHAVYVHLERLWDVVGQWNSPGFSHRRAEA